MMLRNFLVAGAMAAVSTGVFAQSSTAMDSTSMKTPDMRPPSVAAPGGVKAGSMGDTGRKMQGPRPRLPKSPLPDFKQADTNGDGQIEWKEAKAQHVKRKFFEKEDYEHNDKLDRTEWMLVGFDTTEAQQGKKTKG